MLPSACLPADPLGLGVDADRLKVRACLLEMLHVSTQQLGHQFSSGLRGICGARAAAALQQWPSFIAAATCHRAFAHVLILCPALPPFLQWYAEAEKTNGRWAMAAVAGILFTEILGKAKWFEAGAQEYWMPNGPLLAVEVRTCRVTRQPQATWVSRAPAAVIVGLLAWLALACWLLVWADSSCWAALELLPGRAPAPAPAPLLPAF